jgi:hypothetical protein
MPIANHFYNASTRKYVALFGTLFNKMTITRDDKDDNQIQQVIVPIAYGPYQSYLARNTQDADLNRKTAITLPRMSFEITGMQFDRERKTSSTAKIRSNLPSAKGDANSDYHYVPTPYNINFNLYVMAKYSEDGTKVMEQILPFFRPDYTASVKIIPNIDPVDVTTTLNDVSMEDVYETDMKTRRSIIWTLSFTMKCYFYGPQKSSKVIKFIDVSMIADTDTDTAPTEHVITRVGLTANGEPTTDLSDTVTIQEIDFGDDWGVISYVEDHDQ